MKRYLIALALALGIASAAQAGPHTYLAGQWWKGLSMQDRLDGQLHQRAVARSVLATLEDQRLARLDPRSTRVAQREARSRLRVLRSEMPQTRAALRAEREAAETIVVSESSPASGATYLGNGQWAIPSYIVMCESGGDYGAVNPTSGAYGAYQIMPSTAAAYGCDLSTPAGQDACASEIWAGAGAGAWDCA